MIANAPFILPDMSIQPLVISTKPLNIQAILDGKRLNIGDNEVMTTKNMAIIAPTEIMLNEESITVFERLNS